jgi:hypothetical protein
MDYNDPKWKQVMNLEGLTRWMPGSTAGYDELEREARRLDTERGGFEPPVPRTHIRSEFSGGLAYYSTRTKASVLERNLFARNSAVFRLSPVRCCTSE